MKLICCPIDTILHQPCCCTTIGHNYCVIKNICATFFHNIVALNNLVILYRKIHTVTSSVCPLFNQSDQLSFPRLRSSVCPLCMVWYNLRVFLPFCPTKTCIGFAPPVRYKPKEGEEAKSSGYQGKWSLRNKET